MSGVVGNSRRHVLSCRGSNTLNQIPLKGNGLVQFERIEESTKSKWVNTSFYLFMLERLLLKFFKIIHLKENKYSCLFTIVQVD